MATRIQLVRSYTIFREIDQEVTQVRFGYGNNDDSYCRQQAVQDFLESIPVGELRKYSRHKRGVSNSKAKKAQLVNSLLRTIFRSKYQG